MKEDMNENEVHSELESTGEDNAVEFEIEDIENNSEVKIKKIKERLKQCEQEKMEYMEDLQRTKAEFLNSKRRLEEERIRDKERAVETQIEKLLPLCDSFHMAMSNTEVWDSVDEQWRAGVESIHSQLQNILNSYNVLEINPSGEAFDPNMHEAMAEIPTEDEKMNQKIITVIQNGFIRKTGDKKVLIRPARVTVGIYSN